MNKYEETTNFSAPQINSNNSVGNGIELLRLSTRVLVPCAESLVISLVAAAFVGWIGSQLFPTTALFWAVLVAIVAFGYWFWQALRRLEQKHNDLVALEEMRLNINIDSDPRIGNGRAPEPAEKRKAVVDVEDYTGPYGSTEKVHVDDVDTITKAAREIVAGAPFSSALIRDGMFTRKQWDILKDELLQHGIIVQRDPEDVKKGFEITRAGKAFWREMAK